MQTEDNPGREGTELKITKHTVNLTEADLHEVDAVVEHHRPFVRRHAVLLVALRLGLRELVPNPRLLIEQLEREQQRRASRS